MKHYYSAKLWAKWYVHAVGAKLLFGKIPVIENTTKKPVITCFVLGNEWPGDNRRTHTDTSNPAAHAPRVTMKFY